MFRIGKLNNIRILMHLLFLIINMAIIWNIPPFICKFLCVYGKFPLFCAIFLQINEKSPIYRQFFSYYVGNSYFLTFLGMLQNYYSI